MLSVKMFFSFFSFFFLDLNGNDSLTAIMTLSKEKENYLNFFLAMFRIKCYCILFKG